MPDTLSLSAGVSLGLLAGIVSGVCYLVANGLTRPKDDGTKKIRAASRRKRELCVRCGGDSEGRLVPCVCHYHKPGKFESGAWFLRQVQRAFSLMPWSISTDKLEQIEEENEPSPGTSDATRSELRSIREFLEILSARLAGGTLEGTRVSPLYDHPAYLPPPRHGSPSAVGGDSSGASSAHAQLKRLVARVVDEAAGLPALARYAAESPHTPTIESSTYEDLLATAILNKVIERYQTENGSGGRSSGIHSASASPSPSDRSSPRSLTSRNTRDITPPLREEDDVSDWEEGEATDEAVELPRRVPFPEFGGDIIHHDNEDRDFDEISSSDIQAVDGTWEENWLFQKKKIKTIQSVPVPMLVPNSNAEFRALIGDRDAEDTTDLSDNASDADDKESGYKSDIKRVLDSKHVIGGKVKVEDILTDDYEPDSLMTIDGSEDFEKLYKEYSDKEECVDVANTEVSKYENKIEDGNDEDISENKNESILVVSVNSGPLSKAEFNLKEEIHRSISNEINDEYLMDLNNAQSIAEDSLDEVDHAENTKGYMNTFSRHEREGEYEETVSLPVQRYADSLRRKHFEDETKECITNEYDKEEELIPGSIAYRERKKWLNYVDMPNNPYSPEAIQKRLLAKSTSSLFDSFTSRSRDDDTTKSQTNLDFINSEKETNSREKKRDSITDDELDRKVTSMHLNEDSMANKTYINGENESSNVVKDVLLDEVPEYKRYGRDYYIKDAKTSCGGGKNNTYSDTSSLTSMHKSTSLDNFDTELTSPGLLIKQFTTIATNQHYNKFAGKDNTQNSITTMPSNNTNNILIEYEDVSEQTLFSAKPAFADDDTDKKFEEILRSAYNTNVSPLTIQIDRESDESEKSPNNLSVENSFVSSSSLEDTIKIYNVQTGEIVKCKPEDKLSPRYETATDRNYNIDIPDKNFSGETVDTLSKEHDVNEEPVILEEYKREASLYKISEIEEILPQLPKVKELAKKFVSMENLSEPIKPPQPYLRRRKSKENILDSDTKFERPANKLVYMHSLTARSISKEFRDELKLSMATPLTIPGGSKAIPEGTEEVTKESSRPGSPQPEPGTIKTKLAFFESLKSKFSSK